VVLGGIQKAGYRRGLGIGRKIKVAGVTARKVPWS
jgi:hypothetical protein